MSVPISNGPGEGFVAKSLDAAASTGAGIALLLKNPCSKWSVSTVMGTTAATVLLEGSAASSSDAPFATIMSVAVSTAGGTNSTSGFVAKQVRLTLDAVSSSAKTLSGWIAGTP